MKKLYFLLVIFIGVSQSLISQSITSITITPSNPTTNDTVQVVIECTFPSGGCEGSVTGSAQVGNIIYAEGFHCMGMLTVICTDYDTVIIPPLSVGQYSFIYSLTSGQGPSCTSGIVPDDTDTLTFDVENATGLEVIQNEFLLVIEFSGNNLIIQNPDNKTGVFSIFSSDGKLVISKPFGNGKLEIVKPESTGIYLFTAESKGRRYTSKIVILN